MGNSGSKAARTGASKVRTFPSTPNAATRATRKTPIEPAAQGHSPPPLRASTQRNDAISIDARDPAFAARLQKLGIVQPNPFIPLSQQPHMSRNQSQPLLDTETDGHVSPQANAPDAFVALDQNPALLVLRAREALQRQHDVEQEQVGTKGFNGRSSLDVGSLREAVRLRGQGVKESDIEKKFGLREGVLGRIGPREIVDVAK